jgi:hypothetical protein
LKATHTEIGIIYHDELHPIAGGQIGDALQAEVRFELAQEAFLTVFGHMQLTDALNGRIPVVKADDMEVSCLHCSAKVVQARQSKTDLGFIGFG